jgi:homoserine kinase
VSAPVTVRVPGSTSNLGAGFDCVGIALDRRLELTLERTTGPGPVIERGGTLAELTLPPEQDRLWVGFAAACRDVGREAPRDVKLKATSQIPIGRGLGSSGAATVAGAAGANALLGLGFDNAALLRVCAAIEGHPDNAAPGISGGAVLVLRDSGGMVVKQLDVHPSLALVLAVPGFSVDTGRARAALPQSVAHSVAAAAAARGAALVYGLAHADREALALALDDVLHVPYRRGFVPGYEAVTRAAREAGAFGATLSGSGSAIIALAPRRFAEAVGGAMARAWAEAKGEIETFVVTRPAGGLEIHGGAASITTTRS